MKNTLSVNKKLHIEALRIIAISLVLFNHTGTNGFQLYSTTSNHFLYYIYMLLAAFCKIAVPIFFMISGALILSKEESIEYLYKKRILKIVCVLVLFSLFQYILKILSGETPISVLYFFKKIYKSNMVIAYWYLYAYLSFLIISPFIKKMLINFDESYFKYFFTIYFIFSFFLPFIEKLLGFNRNSNLDFIFKTQYIFFPIAGYYFEHIFNNKKIKKIIFYGLILSIISYVIVINFTIAEIYSSGDPLTQKWLGTYTAAPTITIYLIIKYIFENYSISYYIQKLIILIGECTFVIYLIEHNLKRFFMSDMIKLLRPYIKTIPANFVSIILTLIIGTIITILLRKIPILNRLI